MDPRFCVYIVESVQLVDIESDRLQCERLAEMLSLAGTPAGYAFAHSEADFYRCVSTGVLTYSAKMKLFPILHLTTHGNPSGIVLFDGTPVPWVRLRELLQPLFEATNGSAILCMSSCSGLNACGMTLAGARYHFIVGSREELGFSDSAVAFASFYHLLAKNLDLKAAVSGMNAACGQNTFEFTLGPDGGKRYLQLFLDRRSEQ